MTSELERMVRKGLREHADAVTVTVPPLPVAAAPVSRGRLRLYAVPAMAAVVVAAIVVLLPQLAPEPTRPALSGPASLPSSVAGFSFLTGDLSRAPIGRAIAVYRQQSEPLEDHMGWHTLLLDADTDRYRRVGALEDPRWDTTEGISEPEWLLAPDGRRLAVREVGHLAVLDIATSTMIRHPVANGHKPQPLAWSPDGIWLAYTDHSGPLSLFNIETKTSIRVPGVVVNPLAATFSPDGTLIAVQVGDEVVIVDRQGEVHRRLPLLHDLRLVNAVSWSPDGRLLAINRIFDALSSQSRAFPVPESVFFIDATTGDIVGQEFRHANLAMMGWRTDRSIVVWRGDNLTEVSVDGGPATTLVLLRDNVALLQLAPGLLTDAVIRQPGSIDRGPWPVWAQTTLAVALITLAAAAIVIWRRRSRQDQPGTKPVDSRWFDAIAVLGVLAAILLLGKHLRPLADNLGWALRFDDPLVLSRPSWLRIAAWTAVAVAVLCRRSVVAAAAAWVVTLGEAILLLLRDFGQSEPGLLAAWPLLLGVITAVTLSVPGGARRGVDALGRRGTVLVAAAGAVAALAPLLQVYLWTEVVALPDGSGFVIRAAVDQRSETLSVLATYAVIAVLIGIAVARLGPPVRRRVLTLLAPAIVLLVVLQLGFYRAFSGAVYVGPPILKGPVQLILLAVAPLLAFAVGLIILRSRERDVR